MKVKNKKGILVLILLVLVALGAYAVSEILTVRWLNQNGITVSADVTKLGGSGGRRGGSHTAIEYAYESEVYTKSIVLNSDERRDLLALDREDRTTRVLIDPNNPKRAHPVRNAQRVNDSWVVLGFSVFFFFVMLFVLTKSED